MIFLAVVTCFLAVMAVVKLVAKVAEMVKKRSVAGA
jgi:hypothetical protein